jgi:predicted peptidase
VAAQYSIDRSRIYATGESMGAMMTIGMNLEHPDLFAASYVVAGQWPTEQTGVLARKRLCITVSQGDTKAYPAQNDITALAERNGAKVARAVWDARSTQQQFSAEARALTAQGAAINYVAFQKGSTLPAGASETGGGSEHMGTWHVAYGIPDIRDWIMQQHS